MKPSTKQFITAAGVGMLIAVFVMVTRGIFGESELYDILVIINDAFFISGVCLLCAGGLVFVSDNGVFRMLSYSVSLFFQIRKKDIKERKYKDYYEYKQAKEEKKHSCAHLLVVGLAFIAAALVLLIWI